MDFDCPDIPAVIRAIDQTRIVTHFLSWPTVGTILVWTLLWETAVKWVWKKVKGR